MVKQCKVEYIQQEDWDVLLSICIDFIVGSEEGKYEVENDWSTIYDEFDRYSEVVVFLDFFCHAISYCCAVLKYLGLRYDNAIIKVREC